MKAFQARTVIRQAILTLLALSVMGGNSDSLRAQKPHLVVVIVAEQFRTDYFTLYRAGLSEGGFRKLLREGAVFRRARYDHVTNYSAPNAAILATGAYPELNGIVGDYWYDRASRQVVGAVTLPNDPQRTAAPNPGPSPVHLIGSTFADELRLATVGESRVVSVSDEPEPAVLLGGRRPTGCYWMKPDGRFETSTYYQPREPEWVQVFNESHSIMRYDGEPWVAVDAPADAAPLRLIELREPRGRENFLALYHASPFAIADVFEFAKRSIEVEKLGERAYSDLLVINVSAPERLGLETGAHSPLMRDLVLRFDRILAEFLVWLDQRLGLDKVSIVFTALHGIPPLPEEARRQGLNAGRIRGEDVVKTISETLQQQFGSAVFVEKYLYPFVYLNERARQRSPTGLRNIIDIAGEAASEVPGVAFYYNPGAVRSPATVRGRFQRSWYRQRSGDLMLSYDPYFVEYYGNGRGTASGSFYRYDTDVPLIFMGAGFKGGYFDTDVDAASIAPTLSAMLGIPAPSSATARVLGEAIPAAPIAFQSPGPPKPK